MIINNTLSETLTYKIDNKVVQLQPGINLVEVREDYLRNLMNTAFFLKEATLDEYYKSEEEKNKTSEKQVSTIDTTDTNKESDIIQETKNNLIILKEEIKHKESIKSNNKQIKSKSKK